MRNRFIIEKLLQINPRAVLISGLDDAIIGYTQNTSFPVVAVYDVEQCISILSKTESLQDATYNFEYNILNVNHGENTPVFVSL